MHKMQDINTCLLEDAVKKKRERSTGFAEIPVLMPAQSDNVLCRYIYADRFVSHWVALRTFTPDKEELQLVMSVLTEMGIKTDYLTKFGVDYVLSLIRENIKVELEKSGACPLPRLAYLCAVRFRQSKSAVVHAFFSVMLNTSLIAVSRARAVSSVEGPGSRRAARVLDKCHGVSRRISAFLELLTSMHRRYIGQMDEGKCPKPIEIFLDCVSFVDDSACIMQDPSELPEFTAGTRACSILPHKGSAIVAAIEEWREQEERELGQVEEEYISIMEARRKKAYGVLFSEGMQEYASESHAHSLEKEKGKEHALKRIKDLASETRRSISLLNRASGYMKKLPGVKSVFHTHTLYSGHSPKASFFSLLIRACECEAECTSEVSESEEREVGREMFRHVHLVTIFSRFFPPDLLRYALFVLFRHQRIEVRDTMSVSYTYSVISGITPYLKKLMEERVVQAVVEPVAALQQRIKQSRKLGRIAAQIMQTTDIPVLHHVLSHPPDELLISILSRMDSIMLTPENKHEDEKGLHGALGILQEMAHLVDTKSRSVSQKKVMECVRKKRRNCEAALSFSPPPAPAAAGIGAAEKADGFSATPTQTESLLDRGFPEHDSLLEYLG